MELIKNLIKLVEDIHFTVKAYLLAGFLWSLAALALGLLNQVQFFVILGIPPELDYGYVRPLYTTALIYGALLSFFFGASYYILKNVTGSNPPLALAAWAGFKLHQIAVLFGIITILVGYNSGREYGELNWIADNLLIIALVLFLVTTIQAVIASGKKDATALVPISLAVVAGAGGLISYFFANFGLPNSPLTSVGIYRGMMDATLQEMFRYGVLGYFILFPCFAMLSYFVPSYYKVPLYSTSAVRFHTFAMIILLPLAGASGLAFSAAPGLQETVGVFTALALGFAILAGAFNVRNTLTRSGKYFRSDAVGLTLRWGLFFLIAVAVLRIFATPFFMQAAVGYTAYNVKDLSLDVVTYALPIAIGVAFIITQKISNRRLSPSAAGWFVFLFVLGAALLWIGSVAGGLLQGASQSALVDGGVPGVKVPEVTDWTAVLVPGSLYQGEDFLGKFLISLRGLAFFGYLLIVLAVLIASLAFLLHHVVSGPEYSEPDLEDKERAAEEAAVAGASGHGAH